MYRRLTTLILALLTLSQLSAQTDRQFNQIDEDGNISQRSGNGNFNKHSKDTTQNKVIPKGLYSWTIDRRFGDVIPTEPDTLSHLFMNTTFNTGMYGDYNTTGNNYSARMSRIFIDRPYGEYHIFTEPYSFVKKQPDAFLFMNTLSPYTSILYDNCGDKTNGEDHIDAKFAVNANKRLNFGFDLDYAYARGYYSNQSIAHFNGTIFSSYLGDRYQMHFFFNAAHQKTAENGGITSDDYVTHPESFTDNYTESEIPTVLSKNWNRNDHQHIYLSHRYNLGFYRMVKMSDEEIKARQFAKESQKEHEADIEKQHQDIKESRRNKEQPKPTGRPEGAKVMGKEPQQDQLTIAADTTRIKVDGQAAIDSLNHLQAIQDSIDATMKREYVPVTSFIHTLDIDNYNHIYQAYNAPADYYKDTYYNQGLKYGNDSIYDQTKHFRIKNTLGLALLEGFNKYMKAGLKGFVTYDYCTYSMPDIENGNLFWNNWNEYDLSIGAQLSKTQGKTLHFNATAETWIAGADKGDYTIDFSTDLNFPLFGDTVQLAASAYLYHCYPVFFQSKYHSKHLWWDLNLDQETRSRIEGTFSYQKTDTKLRVAIDNIKNYTYYGMSYDLTADGGRKNMTASVLQESKSLNILTAQIHQNFRIGALNWENILTYQNSSNQDVLPLPDWNIFSNLYLKFKIAKVLGVELGADATFFSKYYAPDFCAAINQFAVQKNEESRIKLGGYPFVDVYANMTLKGVRFFLVMSNVVNGGGNHMKFLTPHYPVNGSVLHFGVSWPFFN
ncbi:putative porin [Prevotella sp. P6B4]|uniref:putative porin n=1 Tax=Prevotella sp. P6B4 TaxID=1410614 RepID=UPI00048CADE0|nr:putative porin [Prevotella sp. P6B4]